jgi:hypothetical protein
MAKKETQAAPAAPVVEDVGGVTDPAPPATDAGKQIESTSVIPAGDDPRLVSHAVPPLSEFIKKMERDTQEKYGLAITTIAHPEAEDGKVFDGTYAGIRLVRGKPGMVLSDGRRFGSLEQREGE